MGKDREGKYHPAKGKPSGAGKDEGIGLDPRDPNFLEENINNEEKFTNAPEDLILNAQVRHPNRNVSKGEGDYAEKNALRNKSKGRANNREQSVILPEEIPALPFKETFAELAHYSSANCISIYMPTYRAGFEVNEQANQINFKNALQNISQSLKENGTNSTLIQSLLEPGYSLLQNDQFWHNQLQGLAVFIAHGYFKYMKMPFTTIEKIVQNTSFYLSPLIPLMTTKEYFYILVISKKQSKLYRADAFNIEFLPVDELPNGVNDVVHFEEKEDNSFFRMGDSGSGITNFHGIGSGRPEEKENIALYLEEVDETLWKEILHAENVPLLLAGVEYLIPIYRQVTGYKNIWNDPLTGNFEHEDIHTLHKKALEKMSPFFRMRTVRALNEYANKSATSLTSAIAADIIPAAYYSRISSVFVLKGEHLWGTFDDTTNELTLHEEKEEGDECLLDKVVLKTLQNGGEVFILEKDQMPADSKIAAVMRY